MTADGRVPKEIRIRCYRSTGNPIDIIHIDSKFEPIFAWIPGMYTNIWYLHSRWGDFTDTKSVIVT